MTTGLLETKITYLIYDLHRSESGFSIPKLKQSIIHVLQVKKRNLLLSRIQGHHYRLSKFHIYALAYCIGVFFLTYFNKLKEQHTKTTEFNCL